MYYAIALSHLSSVIDWAPLLTSLALGARAISRGNERILHSELPFYLKPNEKDTLIGGPMLRTTVYI
jgi:hypothetical protein